MPMGAMVPGDDEQPATRRDVAKEREIIEANTRAGFAELRVGMTEGFRKTDKVIAELRVDMTEGFRKTEKDIAAVSAKVDRRMTNQTRFLAGLMVTMFGALLAAVLQTG